MANDGVYSKYFTNFNGNGRYTVKCQIKGDAGTSIVILGGQFIRRDLGHRWLSRPVTPVCCGSDTKVSGLKQVPTGLFERYHDAGSFKVVNSPTADIFPPSVVRDFKITKKAK